MNLIPNDFSRCTATLCNEKQTCKRYLQVVIDKSNPTKQYFWSSDFMRLVTDDGLCKLRIEL